MDGVPSYPPLMILVIFGDKINQPAAWRPYRLCWSYDVVISQSNRDTHDHIFLTSHHHHHHVLLR
jgi:hypothetical protein